METKISITRCMSIPIIMASITGARASTSYSIPSMVHGYHKYLYVWDVWDAAIGEILPCSNEDTNLHDPYAVADVSLIDVSLSDVSLIHSQLLTDFVSKPSLELLP